MAHTIKNNKKFKVIAMTQDEAKELGFGVEDGIICMNCNNYIMHVIYYIPVLNDCMCKECFKQWYKRATHYPEDIEFEDKLFNIYATQLRLI